MTALSLLSPAKLNLMLHITGRREDGYHHLQTVFQLLDYGDTLKFSLRQDKQLHLSPSIAGVANHDNLIIRAASLLQTRTYASLGANIEINKILPMGGGLGGGSSNAASTLLALNQLWNTQLSIDTLAEIGLELGADVPVFVRGHSAWAEGIGEQLQAIEIPITWYLVIKPMCKVSTAEVFCHKQLTRDSTPITIAAVFEQGTRNDCESVVRALYPEVDYALTWLSQYAPSRLTGTGACVFCSFADQQSAQDVLNKLPDTLQGFVAKGLNRSPCHTTLGLT
ncbi:MAG: 4-(cytidine 5'-diphospho)-2-C-methyl-D-erythritol kinase [Spongiibacteraceae bacterium]|nr:4-(cytidine 5'-diphospho)-2-C-methyl-D-erythritol kinase [Spongiibacteraceae bacterium]